MKLTIEHVIDLVDQLTKGKIYDYVSGGDNKAKLIGVNSSEQCLDIARVSADGFEQITNMTKETLQKLCSKVTANRPFKFDSVLDGGGNARSTYEAIFAHTTEFYVCKVGRVKHLVWLPDQPHALGKIVMYNSQGYAQKSLEERKALFKTYIYSEGVLKTKAGQDKYWNHIEGPYKDRMKFVWDHINAITKGETSELCDLVNIDTVQELYKDVVDKYAEQNAQLQNRLPSAIIKKYKEFLEEMTEYKYSSQPSSSNCRTKYRTYITAIKSKPFLILAGISGTGKSRIVRELARACWDENVVEYKAQKPRNFEMVQVKPNWHDSSELIGYVSRVSGEPIYIAGDFLRFIARAWEEPGIPYFLCLDEMNLAPVEQYFAEYLSVIESRKSVADGTVKTDPILKKQAQQWFYNLVNELTKTEEIKTRFLRDGICIPQNLIVVGTVNMDETTFSFSRKVLDRAMTIEMNDVDLFGGLTSRYERIGNLTYNQLIGSAVEGVDIYEQNKVICDVVIKFLQNINSKLEGTPFKIAYRTRNEFLLYVVNNLPYVKNVEGKEFSTNFVIACALDEITSMKILSRIEGDETKVSVLFLTELEKVIKEGLEKISKESYADKESVGVHKSISLAKLSEMKKRLSSGYTSFWS